MNKELIDTAMDFIEIHTFSYPGIDQVVVTEEDAWKAIELAKEDTIKNACEFLRKYLKNDTDGHGFPKISVDYFAFVENLIENFKKAIKKNKL